MRHSPYAALAGLALALTALGSAGAQTTPPAPVAPPGAVPVATAAPAATPAAARAPAPVETTAPGAPAPVETVGPAQVATPLPLEARPPCARALVAVLDDVDSARAHAGDPFLFRVAEAVIAPDGTAIPAGNIGYGVVAIASHAGRGGQGGYLVLETRFLAPEHGPHVPVVIDRGTDAAAIAAGGSSNAPGLLGMIPLVGYAVGGYDSLHHGKDATIPRGTRIPVLIGDGLLLGTCREPRPGETAPPVTPAPVPAASLAPPTEAAPATPVPAPPAATATAAPSAAP